MRRICLRWDSNSSRQQRQRHPLRLLADGNVPAVHCPRGNSVRSAVRQNLPMTAGPVRAVHSIKESFARTAALRSRKAPPSTAVTSAAGSQRTLRIRPNSVRSAEIFLTRMTEPNLCWQCGLAVHMCYFGVRIEDNFIFEEDSNEF